MSDLIRRSDAIKAAEDGMCTFYDCYVLDRINAVPSADRPQGKWIIEIDANGNTYGRCSICGMRQYAGQLNFCPDCGAMMKGADDE